MKYDVAELLSSAIKEAGITGVLDNDLNNHSTISLSMKDELPTIHIRNEDDEVWVWAMVMENAPDSLAYCGVNLLPLMMTYDEDFFYTGQPCLYPVDGNLELRAQVQEKHLQSSEEFLSMLDRYLVILQDYRSVLV